MNCWSRCAKVCFYRQQFFNVLSMGIFSVFQIFYEYRIIPRMKKRFLPKISIARAFKIYTMGYVYVWVQNSGTLTFLFHGCFLNTGTFLLAEL